jgi:hypothetical protein
VTPRLDRSHEDGAHDDGHGRGDQRYVGGGPGGGAGVVWLTERGGFAGGALTGKKTPTEVVVETLGVVALMIVTPLFVLSLWYTCKELKGSYAELFTLIAKVRVVRNAVPCVGYG